MHTHARTHARTHACTHTHSLAKHRHPNAVSLQPRAKTSLESLLKAVCYPRAGPKANQEEVTSFGKPLATWLAVLFCPVSFLPPRLLLGLLPL